VHSPELVWEGEVDSGPRVAALVAGLQSSAPPKGVSVSLRDSHTFIEIPTRSWWALATWTVSALMVWFGVTAENWYLLALSPFMMGAAIMQSLGKVSLLIRTGRLTVFEGIGGIGKRHEMQLGAIQRIEYAVKKGRGGSTAWIVIYDPTGHLKFGQHLNEDQLHFVIAFLLDVTRSLAA
jgi:hypothetical protein